jgi:hypothetical protein
MVTDPARDPINGVDPFSAGVDALRLDSLGPTTEPEVEAPTAPVIDLRDATTRVRVEREDNPFGSLSKQERMRLIVRVLCEIVAYGELEDGDQPPVPDAGPGFMTPNRPAING